jgi:hypothetical protein
MPLLVQCDQCRRQLRVPDTAAGRTVRCPLCSANFTVPAQAPPPTFVTPEDEAPAPPARTGPPPLPEAVKAMPPTPPPLPTEAIQAPPVARAVAPPRPPAERDTDDVGEAQPRRRRFPPLRFPVQVQADPDKTLKGRLEAELNADGLSLRQGKKDIADVPVGTRARYLGKNQLAVTVDDRQVTLAVVPPRQYQHRLARDIVAFLRGERASLRSADYLVPIPLYLVTLLPVSVMFLSIVWRPPWAEGRWGVWGAIWGGVGGGLSGAAFALVQRERLAMGLRVGVCIGLGVVTYAAFLITMGLSGGLGGSTIADSAWQEFAPAGGRFRVEMPGTPVARNQGGPGGVQLSMWIVERKRPHSEFIVGYGDIPPQELNLIPAAQLFEGARQGMLASTPNSQVVSEKALTLNGAPGREFVVGVKGHGQRVVHGYLVGSRFFMLLAGGDRLGPDSPEVQRFLKSFQLQEAAAPPPAAVPPATDLPGLLGYWPLDKGPLAKAPDASGGGHDATVVGAPGRLQGARGFALQFPLESYLDYGNSPHFNFGANAPFTVAAWVKTQAGDGPILSQRSSRSGAPVIDLMIEGGRLTGTVRADGPEFGEAKVTGGAVSDGSWHHAALTRNPGGRIALFLDGQPQGEANGGSSAGPITTDLRAAGAELYWAKLRRTGQPYLAGALDEVAIYNRDLSAAEVRRRAGR